MTPATRKAARAEAKLTAAMAHYIEGGPNAEDRMQRYEAALNAFLDAEFARLEEARKLARGGGWATVAARRGQTPEDDAAAALGLPPKPRDPQPAAVRVPVAAE